MAQRGAWAEVVLADGSDEWLETTGLALSEVQAETRRRVLREVLVAIEDPEQRRAASGRDTLGWESARDVVNRLIHTATTQRKN